MEIIKRQSGNPNRRNKYMSEFQVLNPQQVILSYYMTSYRKSAGLSAAQFARIASIYGKQDNVKFRPGDISSYESFKRVPSEKSMMVILKVLKISVEDLSA